MDEKVFWKLTALLVLWASTAGLCRAGQIWDALCRRQPDCPPPSYSRLHYWAPTLARLQERRQGGVAEFFTPTSFPDAPAPVRITPYPCPGVAPAVSSAEYPR